MSIRTIVRRRRSKAVFISSTAVRSPETAATAAACATLETFEVACDWRFAAALITSFGPIAQPTRQPVIAYVFATPLTMMHFSRSSGTTTGSEQNVASP